MSSTLFTLPTFKTWRASQTLHQAHYDILLKTTPTGGSVDVNIKGMTWAGSAKHMFMSELPLLKFLQHVQDRSQIRPITSLEYILSPMAGYTNSSLSVLDFFLTRTSSILALTSLGFYLGSIYPPSFSNGEKSGQGWAPADHRDGGGGGGAEKLVCRHRGLYTQHWSWCLVFSMSFIQSQ